MELTRPNDRDAVHWLRGPDVACGRDLIRVPWTHLSPDPLKTTCSRCWMVMAAIVANDFPGYVAPELVQAVRDHVAKVPVSGWRASRLRRVGWK